jgi:predicted amidohydrolase YtcJ
VPLTTKSISRRQFVGGGAALAGGVLVSRPSTARAQGPAGPAETVLRNGYVYTLDRAKPVARAVAVAGGRVVYAGSVAGVQGFIGPATEVIDLGGRMVMPGIHDGHIHPLAGGRQLTQPNLNSKALQYPAFIDAVARLIAKTRRFEPDTWLEVFGWDPVVMKKRPTKHDLDRLETSRPILVRSVDGHSALANSRALRIAGVTASTPNPKGGRIARESGGEPTGFLYDNAISLVGRKLPRPTTEQDAASLRAAYGEMVKKGITSFLEAATDESQLRAMALLSDRGQLPLRSAVALEIDAQLAADRAELMAYVERMRNTYGRPDIAINTVKMFFDGVVEYPTQTAALLEPYLEPNAKRGKRGSDRGPTYFPPKIVNPAVRALDAAGWQVHVHAIGDRAVRLALDGFEHARRANGTRDNRHTIAHIELAHPDDFGRFRQLGVMANMQLQWAERDSYTIDAVRPYLGRRRWRRLYPAGSLHRAGARLCGGSDWPVDPLLPFRQIEMAVNRTGDEVYDAYPGVLNERQGLDLRSSIAMHTRNSAFQLGQEALSGRIREGLQADLLVLDRNILRVPLRKVSKTKVLMTMVGGRILRRSSRLGS